MLFVQIYVIGVAILVAALLFNALAMKLHIVTWYDFVKKPSSARWFDYVWLFILYPALLGIGAHIGAIATNILPLRFIAIY